MSRDESDDSWPAARKEKQPKKQWWPSRIGQTFGWPTVFAIAAIAFVIWLSYLGMRSNLERHVRRQTEIKESERLFGR
jgi:hypothetical protein